MCLDCGHICGAGSCNSDFVEHLSGRGRVLQAAGGVGQSARLCSSPVYTTTEGPVFPTLRDLLCGPSTTSSTLRLLRLAFAPSQQQAIPQLSIFLFQNQTLAALSVWNISRWTLHTARSVSSLEGIHHVKKKCLQLFAFTHLIHFLCLTAVWATLFLTPQNANSQGQEGWPATHSPPVEPTHHWNKAERRPFLEGC